MKKQALNINMKQKLFTNESSSNLKNQFYNTLIGASAIAVILLSITLLFSCGNSNHSEKPEDIINKWIGKEIKFPQIKTCAVLGKYTPCGISVPKPYRILIYTDSIGCTSCDLRIDVWKMLIKEADTVMRDKVDFVFYFNPKKNEDLSDLFKRENFKNMVYMDTNDELNKINHFPKTMEYQCFLLDGHNKILAVGNPTLNGNVWELYKKTINGNIQSEN